MIPSVLGEVLTPSAVAVDDASQWLVGRAAHDCWLVHPDSGCVAFKRRMGSAQAARVGRVALKPENLSAMVLKTLWADALADAKARGTTIVGAVVTMSACFSNAQRESVRLAARLASVPLRRLVNEPLAAALAPGLHKATARCCFSWAGVRA